MQRLFFGIPVNLLTAIVLGTIILAATASFGLVQSQGPSPDVAGQQLEVYGQR
jgi:hypothetical protein